MNTCTFRRHSTSTYTQLFQYNGHGRSAHSITTRIHHRQRVSPSPPAIYSLTRVKSGIGCRLNIKRRVACSTSAVVYTGCVSSMRSHFIAASIVCLNDVLRKSGHDPESSVIVCCSCQHEHLQWSQSRLTSRSIKEIRTRSGIECDCVLQLSA